MDLVTELRAARTLAGLSARDVAHLARVAPSTVTRIENGAFADIGYRMVQRILDAVDLGADLGPLSRPSAISAARYLLGDEIAPPADLGFWLDRWRSLRLLGKDNDVISPRELAWRAGRSASLAFRPGSVTVARSLDLATAGRRLDQAGIEWANTGDAAANRIADYADETWPVYYVSDLRAALNALGATLSLPGDAGPSMTLIPFDGASEAGRWRDSDGTGLVYAAPWQVVMDCYGGEQRMPSQAEWILDAWEAAA